jgi:hypothetical protein
MDYDAGTGLAQGEQVYDELDRDARSVAHVELPVRFRLVGKQTTWLAIGLALPLFESGITAETGFSAQTALFNAANFALGLETLSPTGVTPTAGLSAVPNVSPDLPPNCSTVTATGVTFTGCTAHFTVWSFPGCVCVPPCLPADCPSLPLSQAQVTAVLDGQLWLSGDTLTWKYTVAMDSSTGETDTYTDSGTLSVTATTAKGHENMEWRSGQPATGIGPGSLAQALDLDVTYDQSCTQPCGINGVESSCPSPIIGGSLEAKRVWTQKPSGTSVADHAAKLTWTGCNQATFQTSTP